MTGSPSLRRRAFGIIFLSNTPRAKLFDVMLIVAILLCVLVVVFESVEGVQSRYSNLLYALEWGFTLLFTAEYILRLWSVRRPL